MDTDFAALKGNPWQALASLALGEKSVHRLGISFRKPPARSSWRTNQDPRNIHIQLLPCSSPADLLDIGRPSKYSETIKKTFVPGNLQSLAGVICQISNFVVGLFRGHNVISQMTHGLRLQDRPTVGFCY